MYSQFIFLKLPFWLICVNVRFYFIYFYMKECDSASTLIH